jgi:6-phosphogluconolactonase
MKNRETSVFKDKDHLVEAAAKLIQSRLLAATDSKPEVHIALTGGQVGTSTLEALASLLDGVDLAKLHIWWIDDRFVASSSNDRNHLQASNAWLKHSRIPPENIHPFPSTDEGAIESAAESFAVIIEAYNPQFDLVLLGMGRDGHVASLFPGSEAISVGDFVVIETNSPKPPAQRLSLSFSALNGANEIMFLVSGKDKAETVRDVFSGLRDLPAGRVSGKTATTWLLDEEAASLITSS